MNRFLLLFSLVTAAIIVCFSRDQPHNTPAAWLSQFQAAEKLYREAGILSDRAGDNIPLQQRADRLYRQSLQQLAPLCGQPHDSIAFFANSRAGYICYLLDSTDAALSYFKKAVWLKEKLPRLPDSFLFTSLLYTGGIHYTRNEPDSALWYYKKAEAISDRYPHPLDESQRLYNRIGVMFYETGNYRQARNYFEKAISVTPPGEVNLRANYQLNIAALLVKLNETAAARKIYESLLPLNLFNNEILHNLGIICLQEKNYPEAAGYFSRVQYTDRKNLDLYYNKAMAYAGLQLTDSAEQYLHMALAENLKWNGHNRNRSYGLLLKFQADEAVKKGHYKEALPYYQQAIMQFDRHFTETDVNVNPEQFTAVFSYIHLFHTLTAKAEALENIYTEEQDIRALAAALYAYRSAFKLADHVERTYTSDEARLFIGQIKHKAHSRPIDIGIRLFKKTQKKEYLEEVYYFDQRNKASVLSLNIQLREIQQARSGKAGDLLSRESALRSAITRLSLKAAGLTDSLPLATLEAEIRDKEIELEKIREQIHSDPRHQAFLATERIPSVNQLHRQLDNSSAVLSYHLSHTELLILLVTANRFEYFQVPVTEEFRTEISAFRQSLYQPRPGQRYKGTGPAMWLYRQLIAPAQASIRQMKRLVIIPDDELSYLPFEALQDAGRHYLFEQYAIQYQYSTALLGNNNGKAYTQALVSFAPFAAKGYADSSGTLLPLPASAEEVKDLNGQLFLDTAATRQRFLDYANHNTVVHLATHATVNNESPLQSYISFYPGDAGSRLYAQEIYDLRLDTTDLVILSACETGSGQLIKGEGMMSLSRAFAYAGCPNIITSLWKAEDRVTAYMMQKLHFYLNKNETRDRALQLARADLLKDPGIDPALKSPEYWANLVLIGEYEPDHKRSNWPWVASGIVLILLTYYYSKKRSLPRKQA